MNNVVFCNKIKELSKKYNFNERIIKKLFNKCIELNYDKESSLKMIEEFLEYINKEND